MEHFTSIILSKLLETAAIKQSKIMRRVFYYYLKLNSKPLRNPTIKKIVARGETEQEI